MLLLAFLLAAVILGGIAFWWLTPRGGLFAVAAILLVVQLMIWWAAYDLDGSPPWSLDRPMLTAAADPLVARALLLLLLYGPLGIALWLIRRSRSAA